MVRVLANQLANAPNNLPQGFASWTVWKIVHEAFTKVAGHTYPRVQRYGSQKWYAHVLTKFLTSSRRCSEYLRFVGAFRTNKSRHIFDQSKYSNIRLSTKINLFTNV